MHVTKPKYIHEDPLLSSPEQDVLNNTLAVLTPIRAHRLSKSEREWRKAKQALKLKQIQIDEMECKLETQKQEHLTRRQELSDTYQAQTISHSGLQDWMGEEKQLLQHLADINKELNALRTSLQDLQTIEQQAKTLVDLRRLENERLKALHNEIEEAM